MRAVRWLLLLVVVLGLLLVALDRVGAWAAERVVADRVAEETDSRGIDSGPPDVTVHGIPFLTQVAAGRYESVTVVLPDVGTGDIQLSTVELVASNVTAPVGALVGGDGSIVADRVDGTATIGWATVAGLADLPSDSVSVDRDGQLRADLPAGVLGVPLTLTATTEATVAGDTVELRAADVTVVEPADVPAGVAELLAGVAEQLSVSVRVPPLPYGVSLDSVDVRPEGLVVDVSARDVPLSGGPVPTAGRT